MRIPAPVLFDATGKVIPPVNPSLIAAAPELLEALRALLADGGPIFHEIENPTMYREIRTARALLRRISA